jgi:hypothetical protein
METFSSLFVSFFFFSGIHPRQAQNFNHRVDVQDVVRLVRAQGFYG